MELMWAAMRERFGLVVETDKPDRLRQLLYTIRRNHMADFINLRLTLTPDGRLWLLNKEGIDDDGPPT